MIEIIWIETVGEDLRGVFEKRLSGRTIHPNTMSENVDYGETEARREEATYSVSAIVDRRRLVRKRLNPRPGDTVLSIGCGPGFEPAELAETVGRNGRVHAVDRSDAMLALAERRCSDLSGVTLARGDAVDLPIVNEAVDAAVAVQIYEYVENVASAATELRRVLRPGGRAVVYDTDFDSLVWHSTDDERMNRILDAWDDHCPRPHLGSQLTRYLREAGLIVERVEPYSILDTRLDEDAFVHHFMQFLEDYVTDHDAISSEESRAWAEDLYDLDESGETFFNLTQYLYVARKPE